MIIKRTAGWLLVALALGACARGGTPLRGDDAMTAPEVPASDASWLHGKVDLAAERGKVVLVEAFHPS